MTLWKHLLGVAEFHNGQLYGYQLAKQRRKLARQELSSMVKANKDDGAAKFMKGMEKGFNRYLQEELGIMSVDVAFFNAYLLGQVMAERNQLLPKKALYKLVKGRTLYDAKANLQILTDGYNDRLRELENPKRPINRSIQEQSKEDHEKSR